MGFSNERMRTGQLVNWFLLDGLELTPGGQPRHQSPAVALWGRSPDRLQ